MSIRRKGGAFGIEVFGVDSMKAELDRLARLTPDELEKAIYHEAAIETTKSRKRCPKDLGPLRASHETQKPVWRGRDVEVTIAVGGPAAPYALPVHENTDPNVQWSVPGTGPKYLESTIRESAPYMGRRVAARVKLYRAGG